jgi:hypothetical protein
MTLTWDPAIPHLEVQTRLEMIVHTPDHPFVSSPASVAGKRHRTKMPHLADASHVGYYLSVNTNCFPISFSVKRISTLPASWVSARNKEDNLGSVSRSAGERYLR